MKMADDDVPQSQNAQSRRPLSHLHDMQTIPMSFVASVIDRSECALWGGSILWALSQPRGTNAGDWKGVPPPRITDATLWIWSYIFSEAVSKLSSHDDSQHQSFQWELANNMLLGSSEDAFKVANVIVTGRNDMSFFGDWQSVSVKTLDRFPVAKLKYFLFSIHDQNHSHTSTTDEFCHLVSLFLCMYIYIYMTFEFFPKSKCIWTESDNPFVSFSLVSL